MSTLRGTALLQSFLYFVVESPLCQNELKSSAETNVRPQQSELARSKEHESKICVGSSLLLSYWEERVIRGDNYVVKTSTMPLDLCKIHKYSGFVPNE